MKKIRLFIKSLLILYLITMATIISDEINRSQLIVRSSSSYSDTITYLPIIYNNFDPAAPIINKLAFASREDGDFDIYQMNPNGTGVIKLTDLPGNEDEPDWSPDGNKIAFTQDGNLVCVFDIQTSIIGCLASGFSPDFSPDGTKIAFSGGEYGNEEIFVMNSDGTDIRQITNENGAAMYPQWRPNGKQILYDITSDILLVSSDGSYRTNITNNPPEIWSYSASWAPDGNRIVFTFDKDNYPYPPNSQIYTMNIDGSDKRQLTFTTGYHYDDEAVWSPDGKKIMFMSNRSTISEYDIYMMNFDGTCMTRLTLNSYDDYSPSWRPKDKYQLPNPSGDLAIIADEFNEYRSTVYTLKADGTQKMAIYDYVQTGNEAFPTWSTNGDLLLFLGYGGIFSVNADGSNFHTIYDNPNSIKSKPSWSPDDKRIVFSELYGDANTERIMIMNSDGSGVTPLTESVSRDPEWSPEGTLIAFFSNTPGSEPTCPYDIYTIHTDGTQQTRLTDMKCIYDFSWSPDGLRIAFSRTYSWMENYDWFYLQELYVLNSNGSGLTKLTTIEGPGNIYDLSWSPGGEQIAFSFWDADADPSFPVIYVIDSSGSNLKQLTDNGRCQKPVWTQDGSKIAYEYYDGVGYRIYMMNIDGTNKVMITSSGNNPVWRYSK